MEKKLFDDLDISKEIKKAVKEIGFEEATGIQTATIPLIMEGKDIIGHSQTGTGKTAAFGIPAVEMIEGKNKKNIQVLIICPTRELVIQASEEIRKFSKYKEGVKIVPVYGGQPIDRQIKALKYEANIVIGTPGRIMDLMRRKILKLGKVKLVVLDEADEMLNMGFKEDVETILQEVPLERQTILFSATMSKEIMKITQEFLKDMVLIKIAHQQLTVPTIDQYYFEVPRGRKIDALCNALDVYDPSKAIVFCNMKKQVEELQNELQARGYMAGGLHGDMRQALRDKILRSFKTGKNDILIATDVAARGIDVDDVEIVFNFDLPQDEEYYVHRIGRTGRAGKSGRAYTFVVGGNQLRDIKSLSKFIGKKILLQPIPSNADIHEIKQVELMEKVKSLLEDGKNLNKYLPLIEELTGEDYTSLDIALALMKLHLKGIEDNNNLKDDLHITYEREDKDKRSDSKKGERRDKEKMARFILDIGRSQGASINVILSGVARSTGLPGSIVGKIDVKDNYSYFDVPVDAVSTVLKSMKNYKIKNKAVTAEIYESQKKKNKANKK